MLIETARHEPNCPIPLSFTDGSGEQRWLTYHFIAVDPQNQDSPHVADVENTEHIRLLLKLDMYSPYLGDPPIRVVKPIVSDKPPRQHAAGKVNNHPTPIPYSIPELKRTVTAPAPSPEPVFLGADYLVSLTVRDLRTAIAEGGVVKSELAEALKKERNRSDAAPRESWCSVAEQFLSGKD